MTHVEPRLACGMPISAFVLCRDQKALDALRHILSELQVAFEDSPEAKVAGQRLASHPFDLVIVDCDQEKDAGGVLEGVRNSDLNRGATTLAVVNGKAGVPGAFRLGAELVISKPVSLEQARGTIRTAIAVRKKSHPETNVPAPSLQPVARPAIAETPAETSASKLNIPRTSQGPQLVASGPRTVDANSLQASNISKSLKPGLSFSAPQKESAEKAGTPSLKPSRAKDSGHASEKPGYPLSAEEFPQKPARRPAAPALVAAILIALLGAGGYAAYTMLPSFHSFADSQYQVIRSAIPGAKKAIPVSSQPAPPLQVAAKPKPVPAPLAPPDGFVENSAQEAPSSSPEPVANAAGKPLIVATSATTSAAVAPATTALSKETSPITVPDDLAAQHLSNRVDPAYPETLRRKGVHGEVVLQAIIAKDGTVDSLTVISGNPQLAAAAIDAVKQWRYLAYLHNGVPVSFQTNVTVAFETAPKAAH